MKINRSVSCIFVAAIVSVSLGAANCSAKTKNSASDLLDRIIHAPTKVSYSALETVTVKAGRDAHQQKSRLTHKAPDCTSWKYFAPSGKVDRAVVDCGKSHWQYLPAKKEVIFSSSLPVDSVIWQERDLVQLVKNYDVQDKGNTNVLGRGADLLTVTPKSGHVGPSKSLWIDTSTGLILKSVMRTSDGKTTVSSALSDLRVAKHIPASEFQTPKNVRKQTVVYDQSASLPLNSMSKQWNHRLLVPTGIPNGYSLESARILNKEKRAYIHLRYFDGYNAISLFEDVSEADSVAKPSKNGDKVHGSHISWRFHAPFRSLTWRERGLKLTLVSDLSRADMIKIANSTKPNVPHR